MCTRIDFNHEKKSAVAAMADGGIVAGVDYSWPRVVVALYRAGETEPVHVIETGLTRNPSRRLGDVLPLIDDFARSLEYVN
jgi:hypothetical protein